MASKNISSRSKVGDIVIDGGTRCEVTRRIGDVLILKDGRSEFYTRHIEGGSRRHVDEATAVQVAVTATVQAQVETQRAIEAASV